MKDINVQEIVDAVSALIGGERLFVLIINDNQTPPILLSNVPDVQDVAGLLGHVHDDLVERISDYKDITQPAAKCQ